MITLTGEQWQTYEHQVQRGWCSYCHAWREAQLDLGGRWWARVEWECG